MNTKAEDAVTPEDIRAYLEMKAEMTIIVIEGARMLVEGMVEKEDMERETMTLLLVAAAGIAHKGGPALQEKFKKSSEMCINRFGQTPEELRAATEAAIKTKFEN
jgi:hypothetical protein